MTTVFPPFKPDRYDFVEATEACIQLEDGQLVQWEKWQKKDIFRPIFGRRKKGGKRWYDLALIGLPKKNGKSTIASAMGVYGLLFDDEPYPEIYSAAGDTDQARIIFNKAKQTIQRSPALSAATRIYRDAIETKDGSGIWKVLSADAPTSHGLNQSMVIWDELWNQRNYDLWEALTQSPARAEPLQVIVTYAGYDNIEGNLLWDLYRRGMGKRNADDIDESKKKYICGPCKADPGMYFFWSHRNLAPWISPEYLNKQRIRLPKHVYERLHENRWTSPEGSMFTSAEVDAVVDKEREPVLGTQVGYTHYLSVDLGLTRDRAVVAIGHRDRQTRKPCLDYMKTFVPPSDGRVSIAGVEAEIASCLRRFRPIEQICLDPWQLEGTAQKLEAKGYDVERVVFSGGNLTRMTARLMHCVTERNLLLYDYPMLTKELKSVRAVQKSYGYRIDHESGQHDDHVIALAMLLLAILPEEEYDSMDDFDEDPFEDMIRHPDPMGQMMSRMMADIPL